MMTDAPGTLVLLLLLFGLPTYLVTSLYMASTQQKFVPFIVKVVYIGM